MSLCESRVRENCMHGLSGGRWPASGQLDAPPPTRRPKRQREWTTWHQEAYSMIPPELSILLSMMLSEILASIDSEIAKLKQVRALRSGGGTKKTAPPVTPKKR